MNSEYLRNRMISCQCQEQRTLYVEESDKTHHEDSLKKKQGLHFYNHEFRLRTESTKEYKMKFEINCETAALIAPTLILDGGFDNRHTRGRSPRQELVSH